jgi:uncharacterized protein (DUF924 family)
MERYHAIIQFWFEDLDEDSVLTMESPLVRKWFHGSSSLDLEIKKNFEGDLQAAAEGKYASWEDNGYGRLALILLFDQFPRNMYRGQVKAFDYDLKALELALRSLKDGFDGRVYFVERIFYFMPLMHSENLEIQENAIEAYEKLLREAERYEDQNVPFLRLVLERAMRHKDAIARFRRFPQRNVALNRRSTSEERDYLDDPINRY